MSTLRISSDQIGAFTSGLCILHCISSPFLFIMNTCTEHCHDKVPFWWSGFDFIFLLISFISVWYSVSQTTSQKIKPFFWVGWGSLAFAIVNEKLHLAHLPHEFIYFPALFLVGLHIYNLKFCQCKPVEEGNNESCCIES